MRCDDGVADTQRFSHSTPHLSGFMRGTNACSWPTCQPGFTLFFPDAFAGRKDPRSYKRSPRRFAPL